MINRDVKKGRNKASRHSANARARLKKILLKRKKKFTYKALVVALKKKNNKKKNSRLCTIFPEFISISKLFPGLDNCWANFKTFSKIQHSTRTLFMNGKQSQPVRGTYALQGYLILSCTLLKSRKSFASSVQLTFLTRSPFKGPVVYCFTVNLLNGHFVKKCNSKIRKTFMCNHFEQVCVQFFAYSPEFHSSAAFGYGAAISKRFVFYFAVTFLFHLDQALFVLF